MQPQLQNSQFPKGTLSSIFRRYALPAALSVGLVAVAGPNTVRTGADQKADAKAQVTLVDAAPVPVIPIAANAVPAARASTPDAHEQKAPKLTPLTDVAKYLAPLLQPEGRQHNVFAGAPKPEAVSEFRALQGNERLRGPLTRDEAKLIRDTKKAGQGDARKYKIPLETAALLRFSADQAHIDVDTVMQKLIATGGNIGNADPVNAGTMLPFKFGVVDWLYIVKTSGPEHGLDYFAGKINVGQAQGRITVDVADPAVLREILSLRDNPMISALLGTEFIKHEGEVPQLAYAGASHKPDPGTATRQKALLTLGFDLGIPGADGIGGPLTIAALSEFRQMTAPLPSGKSFDQALEDAKNQAAEDSRKYTNSWRAVSPADAFAIRQASRTVGVDYGYMMELAQTESGFKTTAVASTTDATGLFQFIEPTWLTELYLHGDQYGLSDLKKSIEIRKNGDGIIVSAEIHDPMLRKYALDLRNDPRLNALIGAESVKENKELLQARLPRQVVTRTDQYLAHFLGPGQGADFLREIKSNPDGDASRAFPAAAQTNPQVFRTENGLSRSLRQVYEFFKAKFYTKNFDNESAPRPAAALKPTGRHPAP